MFGIWNGEIADTDWPVLNRLSRSSITLNFSSDLKYQYFGGVNLFMTFTVHIDNKSTTEMNFPQHTCSPEERNNMLNTTKPKS